MILPKLLFCGLTASSCEFLQAPDFFMDLEISISKFWVQFSFLAQARWVVFYSCSISRFRLDTWTLGYLLQLFSVFSVLTSKWPKDQAQLAISLISQAPKVSFLELIFMATFALKGPGAIISQEAFQVILMEIFQAPLQAPSPAFTSLNAFSIPFFISSLPLFSKLQNKFFQFLLQVS